MESQNVQFSDLQGFVSKVCGTVYQTNANITVISSQIATRCSWVFLFVFLQEVRALQPLHNQTRLPVGVLRVPTDCLTMTVRSAFIRRKNSRFKRLYC